MIFRPGVADLPIQVEAAQNHLPTITPTVTSRPSGEDTTVGFAAHGHGSRYHRHSLFTYRVSDIPSGITVSIESDTTLIVRCGSRDEVGAGSGRSR